MARPKKTNLNYFPFDVDFFEDDKIQLIQAEFGNRGVIVAINLLCKIYKENGYYYKWGDDECLLFSKKVGDGIVHGFVNEVVNGLVRRSFFDKRVFNSFNILTSSGIQKRYLTALERLESVEIIEEYLCINPSEFKNVTLMTINVTKTKVNVTKTIVNDEFSTLIKVNKTKEKEIKENQTKTSLDVLKIFENYKKIINHQKLTTQMEKLCVEALKENSLDFILQSIDNYSCILLDKEQFFGYVWGLDVFMSKQKGKVSENYLRFNVGGDLYESSKIKKSTKQTQNQPINNYAKIPIHQ